MTKNDILEKIADTIRETFGVGEIDIDAETVADDIPGWDSLSHTVLMLTIEQVFGIELDGITVYKNVGDLVSVIAEKINGQG
jgi:acyl carrier protein